jgi:hypothetical protein
MSHLFTFEPVRSGQIDRTSVVPIVAENEQAARAQFAALWRDLGSRFQLAALKTASGAVIWTSASVPNAIGAVTAAQ